jgi:hypothetical protein
MGVAQARADSYWNVWQGNLPDSNGHRAKYTVCSCGMNPPQEWFIRLSWNDTHYMNFVEIGNNGTWTTKDALIYGTQETEYYDRLYSYYADDVTSGVAQAGCENPSGLAAVYTNCRNWYSW